MWSTTEESIASLCRELLVRESSFVTVSLVVVTALLAVVVLLFRKVWVRESGARQLHANIWTSFFAFAYFCLLLDVLFFGFYTESVGSVRSLTGKRWFCVHWKPLNSLGYRDVEVSRMQGMRRVLVLGDSFAAGHGVDDYRHRFSNLLEKNLGDGWAVANVARIGWQTSQQIRALQEFPYDPDIVVLSYSMNDIFGASRGYQRAQGIEPRDGPPGWLRPVVENSHLWDYVFLKTRGLRSSGNSQGEEHRLALLDAHDDPIIWSKHRQELLRLVSLARNRGAQPLVVVWPRLTDLENTSRLTAKIAELMRDQGVPVIDLSERFAGRDRDDLMASRLDGHPHRRLHQEVGDLLTREICRLPNLDPGTVASTCAKFR